MVNKLKALAERVEEYKALAIFAANVVSRQRNMRAETEAAGMELGLTRAVMNEMLPTLKEAAALIVPTMPEPVTLSGMQAPEIDPATDEYVGDTALEQYVGGPLTLSPSDTFFGTSETARSPEPLYLDPADDTPANALDGTAI
jgi:hypothetical protein